MILRKLTAWSLILATILTFPLLLTSCKSEAAKKVDAIGTVTLESDSDISAAEDALAALAAEDRAQLDGESALTAARAKYDRLVLEAAAKKVEEKISAIGAVTLESESVIAAAEKAYGDAPADVQALVGNYDVLVAAREKLPELIRQKELEDAAKKVEAVISAIGTVTLESKTAIRNARIGYDIAADEVKKLVQNLPVLEAAEGQLASLQQQRIAQLTEKMTVEEDKVDHIKTYTPSADLYQLEQICMTPYIKESITEGAAALAILFSYIGEDWVFFESVTLAVDGQNTTKQFDFFDVERNTFLGGVVELAQIAPATDADIALLSSVANSSETIIRFQGEEAKADFTITPEEKALIRDVLELYECLVG